MGLRPTLVGASLLLASSILPGCTGDVRVPAPAQEVVAAAKAEVGARIGAPEAQIAVIRVEEVAWGDAGLGCPQPGETYAQVITPGYRIILSHKGKEYVYHSDQQGRVILCVER